MVDDFLMDNDPQTVTVQLLQTLGLAGVSARRSTPATLLLEVRKPPSVKKTKRCVRPSAVEFLGLTERLRARESESKPKVRFSPDEVRRALNVGRTVAGTARALGTSVYIVKKLFERHTLEPRSRGLSSAEWRSAYEQCGESPELVAAMLGRPVQAVKQRLRLLDISPYMSDSKTSLGTRLAKPPTGANSKMENLSSLGAKDLGDKIRCARVELGWSAATLGSKAKLNGGTVIRVERGGGSSELTVRRILDAIANGRMERENR